MSNGSPHSNIDSIIMQSTLDMIKRFRQHPQTKQIVGKAEQKRVTHERSQQFGDISRLLDMMENWKEHEERAAKSSLAVSGDYDKTRLLIDLFNQRQKTLPPELQGFTSEEDVYGGKQYTFPSLKKIHPGALAFAHKGRGFLPEKLSEYHPFAQQTVRVHEATHAKRQRGEGVLEPPPGASTWYQRPEEQLASREAGEFVLRKAGLLGKYTPSEIFNILSPGYGKGVQWEQNPNAPVESLVFTEPESKARAAVQEMPAFSPEEFQGPRTYFLKEGSSPPSLISKERPEDIREHWKLTSESIENLLRTYPSLAATKKGLNLLGSLGLFSEGYPSYYENVAVPLSKITE